MRLKEKNLSSTFINVSGREKIDKKWLLKKKRSRRRSCGQGGGKRLLARATMARVGRLAAQKRGEKWGSVKREIFEGRFLAWGERRGGNSRRTERESPSGNVPQDAGTSKRGSPS